MAQDIGEPDRAYRLRREEPVRDGIRRIARGQLDSAHEQLDDLQPGHVGERIHAARKHLKRLRAALRLTRDAIGEETYARENTALREVGRSLSGARDAGVLIQTLDGLHERLGDELAPAATAGLRDQLVQERADAITAMSEPHAGFDSARTAIGDARVRPAGWPFATNGVDALIPGMRRIYRRGRKRMRAARADPTTENLHEARKRVKDLWHAAQILRPAAPKRMKRLAADAHRVADLLGDDHDLAVLRDYVQAHPQWLDDGDRQTLLAAIDRRREKLRRKALKRGKRLYDRSPKAFVKKIERGWRKRVGGPAHPLSS
jgi:CHAD domain-containing protein